MRTKARLVRIGNSRGVRLPRPLIEEAGLSDEVELDAREGAIIIHATNGRRAGWAAAAELAATGQCVLDPPAMTRFDREEWRW